MQASTNATPAKTSSAEQTLTQFSETWVLATFSAPYSAAEDSAGYERTNRGQDIAYDLQITLEEAAKGTEKEIEIPRTEKCDICGGTGAQPGTSPRTCPRCGGTGQVENVGKGAFGMYMRVVTACPTCRGKGKLIDSPCSNCHGSGLVRKRRKISVKVPMGIDEGYQLRLRGEGEMAANGGEAGDLYVIVHVKQHRQFMRDGDDLWYVAMISFPQAALGAEIVCANPRWSDDS